jgi:hypothetical protein
MARKNGIRRSGSPRSKTSIKRDRGRRSEDDAQLLIATRQVEELGTRVKGVSSKGRPREWRDGRSVRKW